MELSLRDMPFGMGGGAGAAARASLAVLNVFGCGRLVVGIGFLRLPASSTSGVTGILTYVRKPGGA
jgi:hypothetical protein